MIITRTPLRVSFVGGGSDLPAFYKRSKGAVLNTTIGKYIYISIHPYFYHNKLLIKYSRTEETEGIERIQHPIVREAAQMAGIEGGIELTSTADVPAGTGLGSSSTFTVGCLHCMNSYMGRIVNPEKLAQMACDIEITKLGEPIGKQDQYAAAYGGLNVIEFHPDGSVRIEPIVMPRSTKAELEKNLLMFYLGGNRSASQILSEQKKGLKDDKKFEIQKQMVELVYELQEVLNRSDLTRFGTLLHQNWELKQQLAKGISNQQIDNIYQRALANGALGGKILGAGGTGFLLLYCELSKQEKLIEALKDLKVFPFNFDNEGSKIIYIS